MFEDLKSLGETLFDPNKKYEPAADYGFFGPDSMTWKVWAYPSSALVGFQRAVTIEQLDPNLNAAVEASGDVRYRTRTRYERTMRYFAILAFGDTETACKAADVLVKMHSKAIGIDPVTGGRYDANDPESQKWIHITAWHSILLCYEMFGPGPLKPEEELQYWEECRLASMLQTIDPDTMPRNREEVHAFFDHWRPKLAASQMAQEMTDYILRDDFEFPQDLPLYVQPAVKAIGALLRRAVISTYPEYIRKMFGIQQDWWVDAAVRVPVTAALETLYFNRRVYLGFAEFIIPLTAPLVAGPLLGIPAKNPITMHPREAQKLYGYEIPAETHKEFRAKQYDRVFNQKIAPSNEGLFESEAIIGGVGSAGTANPDGITS